MFQTTHYTIKSIRIPKHFDHFKIAHLSDMHGALHGKGNRDLIERLILEKPDIIVMTGDMADDSRYAVSRAINISLRLRKRFPVYYLPGNHEQTLPEHTLNDLRNKLTSAGVTVLENSRYELQRNGEFIRLYGLVTPMVYYKDPLGDYQRGAHFSAEDTRKALGSIDHSYYNILLAHNPLYFPSYRDWGADLTLSGHVHGGIIRIPKLGGLLSPEIRLFPKYDAGHFVEDQRHLIVSRGLGNNFLTRINNPAELVLIKLRRS